jgi:hypothetical protein
MGIKKKEEHPFSNGKEAAILGENTARFFSR